MNWFQNALTAAKQNPRVQLALVVIFFLGNSMVKDRNHEKENANIVTGWRELHKIERKDKLYFREKYLKELENKNIKSEKDRNKSDSIINALTKALEKKQNDKP